MKSSLSDIEEVGRGLLTAVLSILIGMLACKYVSFGKFTIPIIVITVPIICYKLVYSLWKPPPPIDFFGTFNEIISELKSNGHTEWSQKLQDMYGFSQSRSEVIGEIRFRLVELQKTGIPEKIGIQGKVDLLIHVADSIFGNKWREPWNGKPPR